MPFIAPEARAAMAADVPFELKPGDKCFYFYVTMQQTWALNPRWTTADTIKEFVDRPHPDASWQRAKELAWDVFFAFVVLPYEAEMLVENGDVTGDEEMAAWVKIDHNVAFPKVGEGS